MEEYQWHIENIPEAEIDETVENGISSPTGFAQILEDARTQIDVRSENLGERMHELISSIHTNRPRPMITMTEAMLNRFREEILNPTPRAAVISSEEMDINEAPEAFRQVWLNTLEEGEEVLTEESDTNQLFNVKQYLYDEVRDELKDKMDVDQYWEYINTLFGELEYDIQKDYIIIKYPDTVCSDTRGNSTPIYEPYVRVKYQGYTKMGSSKLSVTRTKYTESQKNNRYVASHAHGTQLDWTGICTGTIFTQYENFSDFLFFVVNIFHTFWKTENASPRPLCYISSLRTGNIEFEGYVLNSYDFTRTLEVDIENVDGVVVPVLKHTDKSIDWLKENEYLAYRVGDKWYRSLAVNTPAYEETRRSFIFKGIEITANQIIPDNVFQNESIEKEPHMGMVEKTTNYYQKLIAAKVYYELKRKNTSTDF